MAKRRIIVNATASTAERALMHTLFSEENEWQHIDVETGAQALAVANTYGFMISLFVLDAALADKDGIAAIRALQTPPSVDCPPIVVILPREAALSDYIPDDAFVSEILYTPVEMRTAYRRLRGVMDLHEYQKKDVTFQHIVSRDPLIGLLNGKALPAAVDRAIARSGESPGLFAYINIDSMRAINERSGHHFGDLVLIDAARTLTEQVPPDAVLGRPYGDAFCIYMPYRPDEIENIRLMEAIKAVMRRVYPDAPGGPQHISVCIGVAQYPRDGADFAALYDAAETAGGLAKQNGRNVLLFYTEAMRTGGLRNDARLAHVFEEGAAGGAMSSPWYYPVIDGMGYALRGYDYIAVPSGVDPSLHHDILTSMSGISQKAQVHYLRMDVRRFFGQLATLKAQRQGRELPRFSFYAVLCAEQAEMLPQILQEALDEQPTDTSRLCVNIPQDMALGMTHARLETLARDVRAMGFTLGVFNVGEQFILNSCYMPLIFDRIAFCPDFLNEILAGIYPSTFLERVLGFIMQLGTVIAFPMQLSEASRATLVQSLGADFGSYDTVLPGEDVLLAHLRSHDLKPIPDREQGVDFSLRISDDRYNEIFAKSGIIIDWRPQDDTYTLSESFYATYGHPNAGTDFHTLLDQVMHPDDRMRLQDLLLQVKHGRPSAEGIFRVRRRAQMGGDFRWRRFFLISIAQENGVVSHVYSISFDVDRERREMQDFMKRAETDPLTQLLNRGATEGRIRAFLEGDGRDGQHALMLVDLDDFKSLNDRLGHIAGDQALQYIAQEMQKLFRQVDVVGRIGGDEFMVFLKNISSEEMIASRAEDINNAARRADPEWRMACTVGIARYPMDGTSFQTLYAKADLALYEAKAKGKNRWSFA